MARGGDERGEKGVAKVAVVIMSDTETHADRARAANALTTAYEFKEADEEVTVVFTGAGTRWIPTLADPENRLHRAYKMVEDKIAGACKACAVSFGVKDEIEASGVPLLTEYRGHQSIRRLINEGYEIVSF